MEIPEKYWKFHIFYFGPRKKFKFPWFIPGKKLVYLRSSTRKKVIELRVWAI